MFLTSILIDQYLEKKKKNSVIETLICGEIGITKSKFGKTQKG
jgi:hypothetical protein